MRESDGASPIHIGQVLGFATSLPANDVRTRRRARSGFRGHSQWTPSAGSV
jgi:hypothetical protein